MTWDPTTWTAGGRITPVAKKIRAGGIPSPALPKDDRIVMRISTAEKAYWIQVAARYDKDLSEFIRLAVNGVCQNGLSRPQDSPP